MLLIHNFNQELLIFSQQSVGALKRLIDVLHLARDYLAGKEVPEAKLSAEHLLAHVLGLDRLGLYLNFERPLGEQELERFRELLRRRAAHEPLQYILGETGFRSLTLATGPGALIPRPETELLVDLALEFLDRRLDSPAPARVLDLCCGTGAVGLALATERKKVFCVLSDLSGQALGWAARNLHRHGESLAGYAALCCSDLLEAFPARPVFDMILSNPPYVSPAEMGSLDREIREYEPSEALDGGGEDGTLVMERIVEQAAARLYPGGMLAFEIGETQRGPVARIFKSHGELYSEPEFRTDLAGKDRFAIAYRK